MSTAVWCAKRFASVHNVAHACDSKNATILSCTNPSIAFVIGAARNAACGAACSRASCARCSRSSVVTIWVVTKFASAAVTCGSVPRGPTVSTHSSVFNSVRCAQVSMVVAVIERHVRMTRMPTRILRSRTRFTRFSPSYFSSFCCNAWFSATTAAGSGVPAMGTSLMIPPFVRSSGAKSRSSYVPGSCARAGLA